MFNEEHFIVFPEGDIQEVGARLRIGTLVDVNGNPLVLPLASARSLAFQVSRISVRENRGGNEVYHYLDLMTVEELRPYAKDD
jgi:hypothetical protein